MLTKIENSKIHAEDLSLMEDELLKIRTKITVVDRLLFANIIKVNLILNFPLIMGDIQIILKVTKM